MASKWLLAKSFEFTNVYNTPLTNGSASDYSAIFTGITIVKDITQYLRGCGSKAIISLDLDLYEKVYRRLPIKTLHHKSYHILIVRFSSL